MDKKAHGPYMGAMRDLEHIKSSRIYGRRQGKPLKPSSQRRLEEWLPRLQLSKPESGASLDPAEYFDRPYDGYALEIGFGKGEHLAWQAAHCPDWGHIGCEPFLNGVSGLVDKVVQERLENVRIFMDDARLLMDGLRDQCLDRAYILFPDPWPKKRHHKRRVINPGNIRELARLLKCGAELRIATDHRDYCRWILSHMLQSEAFDWLAEGPANWHRRPDDWPPTRYEQKALEQGRRSTYLRFIRKPRR